MELTSPPPQHEITLPFILAVPSSSYNTQLQNNLTKKQLEVENAEHAVEIEKTSLEQKKKVGALAKAPPPGFESSPCRNTRKIRRLS